MKAPPSALHRWPFVAFCAGIGCLFLVAAATEPWLDIQRQGDQIILSISNRPPGSVLETATDLTLPLPWQEAITLSNNQHSLTLDATNAVRFFRLRALAQFDVAAVAPPLNETSFPDVASATEFLYSGTNGIQTGVLDGAIQPARASVLRGRVLRRDGSALAGVRVSVLDHPEFGQTFSRGDGRYDLAVNGGFELRVNFEKTAHLPAQRSATIIAQDYNSLPDVILIPLDPVVTVITLGVNSTGDVARGSTQTDSSGTRTATLLLPPGIRASLVLPNGTTQEVSSLSFRATEYTVGSNGPAAMPAALPPSSGYTYAVELSADEAINAGAKTVTFNQDIPFYVENFIGFPVGVGVPSAFYDRERAAWIPTPDGRVIRIVQVLNNLAEVDANGDGLADADQGASLGITTPERQRLATLYAAGQTLWRVPIRHFSPYDLNYGVSPAPGATPPRQPEPQSASPKVEDPTQAPGYGVVDIENQVLREGVPIVGTPFSLEYSSDQAAGDPALSQLLVQVSGTNVPAVLKRIRLTIEVSGRTFTENFPAAPNQSHLFIWDGRDAYGRKVPGQQTARVRIDYIYDAYYNLPRGTGLSFGLASGQLVVPLLAARDSITFSQSFSKKLGGFSRKGRGLAGWGLSAHHIYDPEARVLYLGTGERRSAQSINLIVKRIAGFYDQFAPVPLGDGGPALDANLNYPYAMAFGPDGSMYLADLGHNRVRRVTPGGIINTAAGTGVPASYGDGGPAQSAGLNGPTGVAVGPDGSVYIAEDRRVRRIAPDGIISTVAGTGQSPDSSGPNGDGGPATQAKIDSRNVAVAPDGTLYLAGQYYHKIRRVGPDGIITTFAGTGTTGFSGDGGPAIAAQISPPYDVAVGPDGSVYIADTFNRRVRRVAPDGIITTFAGGGGLPLGTDGVPATELNPGFVTSLDVAPDGTVFFSGAPYIYRVTTDGIAHIYAGHLPVFQFECINSFAESVPARQAEFDALGVTMGPDGAVYFCDNSCPSSSSVRRISPPLPGFDGSDILIPSSDASEVYVFDKNGRHLRTVLALTGATLLEFHYDTAGRLSSVQDGNGLVTTLEHDALGNPTGVLAPFGQHTTLTTTPDGNLASVMNPAGETTQLGYAGEGLLTSVTGPKGDTYAFSFDGLARVVSAGDPAGGSTTLVRTNTPNGREVQATSALGRVTRYLVETLTNGVQRRVTIYPDGTQMQSLRGNDDGTRTTTLPSGTVISSVEGPDPRFGMQSPVLSSLTVRTPAGLTNTVRAVREVTLMNPDDPFSLSNLTDTVVINGRTNTLTYSASGRTFIATSPTGRSSTTQMDELGRILVTQLAGLHPTRFYYDALGRATNVVTGVGAELQATVALAPANDTFISIFWSGPNGNEDGMLIGTQEEPGDFSTNRALVRFDLSTVPPGAQITAATLEMTVTDAPPVPEDGVFQVHRLLRDWNQEFSTWELRLSGQAWAASGGEAGTDYDATVSGSRLMGGLGAHTFSSPGMAADVSRWLTNSTENHGWLIKSSDEAILNAARRIGATGGGAAPRLIITYTVPQQPQFRASQFGYDSRSRLQSTVNALGQSFNFDYDAADRLTQRHLPGARTVGFGYDLNGRNTSVTPPGQPAHRFTNNIVNQLASYTPPDVDGATHSERYQYNADRDSTNVMRADGQNIAFTYDAAGRTIRTDYPNAETLNYHHHPVSGLITNIVSPDGSSLTFARDGLLLTNVTWAGAVTGSVRYLYNQDFRVATQLVNSATPISFLYDGDNLLTNAGSLRLTYQPQNALLNTTALGAVTDTRSYNAFGELTNYSATFSNAPLYAYTLAVNALGQITNRTETTAGQTVTYDYAYDVANRLREVRTNGLLAAAYTYDLNGNRLQRTNGLQVAAYSYDNRDRFRHRTVGAELTQFAYTPNGELRTQNVAGASTTYTYDARGNLRQVVLPDATQIEYLVDGASHRIGKKVNGALVKGFLYQNALTPIAELDGNNSVVSRFIYGTRVNVPEYLIRGGATYRILCDHLGSVRLVINAAGGAIAQRMDYDEFGVVLADTNPGFQPFGFAGGLYDPTTGLTRFGLRDYQAETGRWTTRDPVGFNGGDTCLYNYLAADPVNQIDAGGTGPFKGTVTTGLGFGASDSQGRHVSGSFAFGVDLNGDAYFFLTTGAGVGTPGISVSASIQNAAYANANGSDLAGPSEQFSTSGGELGKAGVDYVAGSGYRGVVANAGLRAASTLASGSYQQTQTDAYNISDIVAPNGLAEYTGIPFGWFYQASQSLGF